MNKECETDHLLDNLLVWDKKTILIVDDEALTHKCIEQFLSITNIKVLHAYNGKEAVDMIKDKSDISIILMDISMPEMDGYEATRLIKTIYPKMPIIAQTAYALTNDKVKAIHGGFDCYLTKPIDKNILYNTIAKYLN